MHWKIAGLVAGLVILAGCTEETITSVGNAAAAELSCLNLLNATAGRSDAQVADITDLEDGYSVLMDLPGAEQPWACNADSNGVAQEVFYLGEG